MRFNPVRALRLVALYSVLLSAAQHTATAEEHYQVLDPRSSRHLVESAHFVARWNDGDNVKLSGSDLQAGLQTLEAIRDFYLGTVGFPAPYAGRAPKYKINVNLSDQGWATGSGTGEDDPAMWLHYDAFKDNRTLAHEFAHCLQFATMGLRYSPYVGWFWECHAEWMTHQMYPEDVGCSEQLLNASHICYGSARDRYGNWLFWEYIKDKYGYGAVNDIWTRARKPGVAGCSSEDPLLVLQRTRGWSVAELGDRFGEFAMRNATFDYKDGAVFRERYGSYDNRDGIRRNRVAILEPPGCRARSVRHPGLPGAAALWIQPRAHHPRRWGIAAHPVSRRCAA